MKPRYPVYIPSKGRAGVCYTAQLLDRDSIPFRLVVEPQEHSEYSSRFGCSRVLALPFRDLGQGSIPARNWIKDHATAEGHERHWQLDDNLRETFRWFRGYRVPCHSGIALSVVEDFTDRYENIAISGMNYTTFVIGKSKPFHVNQRVYSCSLILNRIPQRWRGRYNEDTDLCLQVLAAGWCTVLVNAFLVEKKATMLMQGGNAAELYAGDGRAKMARALERLWPGVVETKRRFRRPQHVVKDSWRMFDTPLKLKPGVDLANLPPNDEYGMELKQLKPVKSAAVRNLLPPTSNVG